jgi:serine/threonine-protein kinase
VPGSASGPIDASLLSQLVELLRPVLGAMAELTVRHTARRHGSAMGLVEALAADAVPDEERAAFLSAAHPLLDHLPRPAQAVPAAAASGSRPAPPAGPLPVLGATPMRPGDEQAAQSALARLVGPIATLFVRRAAARAHSREEFYSTLADLAEGSVDRKQVLSALWKSH